MVRWLCSNCQSSSKTKVIDDFSGKLSDVPLWGFDGSSTQQAVTGSSDCLLKPVAIFPDPGRKNAYLVMNEVLNPDSTHIFQMVGQQLTMMMMIFGLDLNKSIFFGTLKLIYLLVFRRIKHLKANFIAQ